MREAWSGKRVLVLGCGITGRSAADYLAERGARVTIADESRDLDAIALHSDVERSAGLRFPNFGGFDLVIPSPGIPPARYAGATCVKSDIEIAAEAIAAPIVAVTGSNGKTSTVLLIEAMLRKAGLRARAAGNVGVPALALADLPLDVAILEVSSFQLEASRHFRPDIAVALNLSPDHLDRHGSLAAYAATKARLFAHQRQGDIAIVNRDDPRTSAMASESPATRFEFSERAPLRRGAWRDQGAIVWRDEGPAQRFSAPDPIAVPVATASLCAALAVCAALRTDLSRATMAWPAFKTPPHRFETVALHHGVRWINDSKATNPGAAQHALGQCDEPVVWIACGREKGELDLAPLVESASAHARIAILFGDAAPRLADALSGRVPYERVGNLAEAVARAAKSARHGESVLLSPAFASFDQFRDYEERGERFRHLVAALVAAEETG